MKDNNHTAWLLPFGSVMILTLTICILLLSVSKIDKTKLAEVSGSIKAAFGIGPSLERSLSATPTHSTLDFQQAVMLVRIKDKLRGTMKHPVNTKDLEVFPGEDGFVVRLHRETIFASENLTIRHEVKPALKQMAGLLATIPNIIRIESHTSDQPPAAGQPFASNWVMSAAEAATVAEFFVTQGGVDPMRLVVRGQGPYVPLESNSTQEGRARNRRIEILLTKEMPPVTIPAISPSTPPANPLEKPPG